MVWQTTNDQRHTLVFTRTFYISFPKITLRQHMPAPPPPNAG